MQVLKLNMSISSLPDAARKATIEFAFLMNRINDGKPIIAATHLK